MRLASRLEELWLILKQHIKHLEAARQTTARQTAARQTAAQQNKRKVSDCETEVAMLQREVQELQRTVQMNSFPYRDNIEEHNSLIDDYLYNNQENRNEELRRRSWDANNRWKRLRRDRTGDARKSRKSW